jgi:hypothetical protein
VYAYFIDWNDLKLFENVVQHFKEALNNKKYRTAAFEALGAVISKK